jgi:hypothetical protein
LAARVKFKRTVSFCSKLLLVAGAMVGLGLGAYHRTPLDAPTSTNLPPDLAKAPIQRLSEDVYQLGLVTLDKKKHTIRFPAQVNMSEGIVEYALVHSTGKVHESVLKTEAAPLHIHLAKLLLGGSDGAGVPKSPITPPELLGRKVKVWVSWEGGAVEQRVPLENLISNTVTRAQMTPGPWIYNGSRVAEGTFLAHRDGSIIAIISDPDALINSPRPGREDDEIWRSNPARLPGKGTPLVVTIQLDNNS